MNLKCHAILKSGKMCGARAGNFDNGVPSCDRPAHYYGRSQFFSMSSQSVYPERYSHILIALEFLSGMNFERIAEKHRVSVKHVENVIRKSL